MNNLIAGIPGDVFPSVARWLSIRFGAYLVAAAFCGLGFLGVATIANVVTAPEEKPAPFAPKQESAKKEPARAPALPPEFQRLDAREPLPKSLLEGIPMVQAPVGRPKTTGSAPRSEQVTVGAGYAPTTVFDTQDDVIGNVVAFEPAGNGKAQYLVVETGGFLGLGSRKLKLPATEFQIDSENKLRLPSSKDQLKAMPEFRYDVPAVKP